MRAGWRGALGIAISAGLLWYVLKDEDMGRVWAVLSTSNLLLWGVCTFFATLIFPLRARRWQALLAPTYGRIPFSPLWQSTAIGMMINNAVGGRLGEPARAFALTRQQPQVKFTAAFASLAVDRLFDGIVVLLMMLLATLDPAFQSDKLIDGVPLTSYLRGTTIFLGVILGGALFLLFAPDTTARLTRAVFGSITPRYAPKIQAIVDGFVDGLRVLRKPALMAEVLLWTVIHWLCNAFAFWIGFKALGIAAPFSAGLLLQGIIAIAVAAPSGPGFFGLFEGAAIIGLTLYGVDRTLAISWGLGFHILSWIPIVVLGAMYLARMKLSLADIKRGGSRDTDAQASAKPGTG
jgi:uncharacterized protein (TIRG00374 family)